MIRTQKARVLAMLRTHGKYGVRSDRFLEVGIPRAAARIWELREEGYEISAEREEQFSRYRLVNSAGVGSGTETAWTKGHSLPSPEPRATANPGGDKPTAGVGTGSALDSGRAGFDSPFEPQGASPDPGGDSGAFATGVDARVSRPAAPEPARGDGSPGVPKQTRLNRSELLVPAPGESRLFSVEEFESLSDEEKRRSGVPSAYDPWGAAA